MKNFLIIDASSIFYRAFYAMPSLIAPTGEPTGAVMGFANIIIKTLRDFSPDLVAIALDSAKKTFRNDIFSDYKANRPQMPDDLAAQLPIFNEFINLLGIKTCAAPNFEADDVIGTLTALSCQNFAVNILTGDRDALQLINSNVKVLLNKKSAVETYDEQKFFDEYGFEPPLLVDFKGLCGDSSDNIPGVPNIGPKTAISLIKQFGTLENVLEHRADIKITKARKSLENFAQNATLSKKLAKIICDVPEITFNPPDFDVKPDLDRLDDFCNRYALNKLKQSIHKFFGVGSLFSPITISKPQIATLPIDFNKILAADKISIAESGLRYFSVKIFGGDVFSASHDDIQTIFNTFNGQIVLNSLKNYLHAFQIANFDKIFDLDLIYYLLYPERGKAIRNEELGIRNDLAETASTFEKVAPTYEKRILDADLMKLYQEMELPLAKVLANMELRGVFVDKASLEQKSTQMSEKIAALEKNIYNLAGEAFNINSPQQLADILFVKLKLPAVKKTKTGFSTNAEVLEEIKPLHPIISEILNFRALSKLKSTYLDGISKLIGRDGRIHTNFNQTVTATGRLSSSDPNLQNIPVRTDEGKEIRALFVPGNGFDCILSADYSQIELRLLAHMSGDENLIDAFIKGQDIHARTASEVFGVPIDDVTPDLRRKAKAVNFGIVYGMSDYGLSQDLHISRREAGEYIVKYFDRYPKVKDFLDSIVTQAHLHGFVTTMFGRRRVLDTINSNNFNVRSNSERMAMNTPIQGSAADIIKLAMIRAEENLQGFDSRIIIQVHDELVLEAKSAELAAVTKILRDSMENVARLAVPLVVDVHHGINWSLAK